MATDNQDDAAQALTALRALLQTAAGVLAFSHGTVVLAIDQPLPDHVDQHSLPPLGGLDEVAPAALRSNWQGPAQRIRTGRGSMSGTTRGPPVLNRPQSSFFRK